MLSGRELALEQNPNATGWVNQRIVYTHGIGVAMVPVNEVTNEGQPRPVHRRTCRRVRRRRAADHPAAHLLRRARPRTTSWSARSRPSSTTRPARATRPPPTGPTRAGPGPPASSLDNTLMRLLFSLRFRDLDLMISDQVTADSQLLFHRSLADRLARIAPFLKFDKDPYIVVDDAGRLVYIQDAYTTSDRFPNAQAFDPGALPGSGLGRRRLRLHPQQREDHRRRLRRDDALLRQRPDRPDRPRVPGRLPDAVHPDRRRCPPTCCATCASRSSCSTSRPRCSGATT